MIRKFVGSLLGFGAQPQSTEQDPHALHEEIERTEDPRTTSVRNCCLDTLSASSKDPVKGEFAAQLLLTRKALNVVPLPEILTLMPLQTLNLSYNRLQELPESMGTFHIFVPEVKILR